MKTRTLFTIVAVLFSFSYSFAFSNQMTNEEFNDAGQKTAVTYYDNSDGVCMPDKKHVFEYTPYGQVSCKVCCEWSTKKQDWDYTQKTVYMYNDNGTISKIIAQKWDNKKQDWIIVDEKVLTT